MPVSIGARKRSYAGFLGTLGTTVGAPANTTAPNIQGTPKPGNLIILSPGVWANIPAPVLTYQWSVDGVDVVGATNERYRADAADAGKAIVVTVTATNSEGATSKASDPVTAWITPTNAVVPAITGTAQVGETLTASTGTWTAAPTATYEYVWAADAAVIDGAIESTYEVVADDIGKIITATVTATNVMGSASKTSAPTIAVIPAA